MSKFEIRTETEGSVTVFLVLSLTLIMSLVLVMLENASSSAGRLKAELLLATSAESAMADYYRPLFDEYGLYALNLGYGTRKSDSTLLAASAKSYADSTAADVYMTDCRVSNTSGYLQSPEIFISQAVKCEELQISGDALNALLAKLGIFAKQGGTASAVKERMEVEKQLAVIDRYTLELMRLLDGVVINLDEVVKEGRCYSVTDSYLKKFMVLPVNAANVQINNPDIYAELADKYCNPLGMAEALLDEADYFTEVLEKRNALRLELEEKDALSEETEAKLNEAEAELNEIEVKLNEAEAELTAAKSACLNLAEELKSLCEETDNCINSSLKVTEAVFAIRTELSSRVEALESIFPSDSLEQVRSYAGLSVSTDVADFAGINDTLKKDRILLKESGYRDILSFTGDELEEHAKSILSGIEMLITCFGGFEYSGMCFDYSGISGKSIPEAITGAAEDGIKRALSDGYLKLLIPGETVSDAVIESSLLPVFTGLYGEGSVDGIYDLSKPDEPDSAGTDIFLDGLTGEPELEESAFTELASVLKDGLDAMYGKTVFALYLNRHFNNYADSRIKSDTVLKYEQEYILAGNKDDRTNLAAAAARLLLLRLIPAAVYAFTDKTMMQEAKTAASALAGFTGLPFLIVLLQYTILLLWAAEQAVVETAAIMRGKKVPIITSSSSFCISMAELATFGPELVAEKAAGFKEGEVFLSYEDYLLVLLLLQGKETAAQRALALIQENIRYAYDEDFLLINSIYGAEFSAEIYMPARYAAIVRNPDFKRNIRGYVYKQTFYSGY